MREVVIGGFGAVLGDFWGGAGGRRRLSGVFGGGGKWLTGWRLRWWCDSWGGFASGMVGAFCDRWGRVGKFFLFLSQFRLYCGSTFPRP